MKRYLSLLTAILMLGAMLSGCADKSQSSSKDTASADSSDTSSAVTTTADDDNSDAEGEKIPDPVVTLPVKEEQIINETPATYESFGIDKSEKLAFREDAADGVKLPIINITTNNEEIVSVEEYISCVVDVFNCDEEQILDEASAGVKVRGNSSAFYGDVQQILRNTVPYRIKFDKKTNMLGMNSGAECKSWVLLKSDWDLIRNDIAFRFGRTIIGDNTFCSDSRFVHLYVNDKFRGIYVLCEQSQINPNRVDVTEPEAGYTDTDIGYYLELDNYAMSDSDNHYITLDYGEYEVTDIQGTTRKFVPAEYSIKNDLYSQNQIDFIDKYLNGVFEIVYRACEKGEYLTFDENYDLVDSQFDNAADTVGAVMDLQSVVDMYLLYELVHDYDCGEGSFYMCVDFAKGARYPRLTFTSPWDFNWAYNDSTSKYWAGAFTEQSFVNQYGDRSNPWFILLIKQDWFFDMAAQKWSQLVSEDAIMNCIREETDILEEYHDDLSRTEEWATDSAYELLKWIYKRISWMTDTFAAS